MNDEAPRQDEHLQEQNASEGETPSNAMLYDDEHGPELAGPAVEGLAGEFDAEPDFADAADRDAYLSAESDQMPRDNLDWAVENDPDAASNYRPSHTPAAERIKRLGSVDMADDLTEAVENYTASPFGAASISSVLPAGQERFEEQNFSDEKFDNREFETHKFSERELDEDDYEDESDYEDEGEYDDERQQEIVAFDDVNEEHLDNHQMFASPVAAALTRPSEKSSSPKMQGATQPSANEFYADENVDEVHDHPDMPRMPETPKWSESARFHMSNMLAASRDNVTPGDLTSRIDTTPDRHRRSSAMMLLGLPALLMIGFSGAYLYHTDSGTDGSAVVANLQSSISATALSIVSDTGKVETDKIAESIIQKQEVESIEIVRSEPNLPPPIAPELVELAPLSTPSEPEATKVANAEAPVATSSVSEVPAIKSIPNLPPLDPPQQIEQSVTLVEPPAEVAKVEPESALPVPVPVSPANEPPVGAKKEPTITPAAAAPNDGGYFSKLRVPDSIAAAPQQIAPVEPSQQVAAITVPPTALQTPEDVTDVALPDAETSNSSDEDAQLIARGTQHLEIGDISAARLLFELAAQNGSSKAATAMGRSYDPVYFQKMGVRGVLPDAEKALEWYEKGINAGDDEATEHLQKLSVWMRK